MPQRTTTTAMLLATWCGAAPLFGQGGTFPNEPFNGMQIQYAVSGAQLQAPADSGGFTTARRYQGQLGTGTLAVSGSARIDWGYGADLEVRVSAGQESRAFQAKLEKGVSQSFSLEVPIPAGAAGGGFSIRMTGHYNAGTRGLEVTGRLAGRQPCTVAWDDGYAVTCSPSPSPAPSPTPPPAATLAGAVQAEVGAFLHQFDQDCLAGALNLGTPTVFETAVTEVDVVHDTSLGPNARYTPGGLFSSPKLALSRDPRAAAGDFLFQQTMWHELIHRREDVNGDTSAPNAGNRDWDERNTEYAEVVAEQALKLAHIERQAKAGGVTDKHKREFAKIIARLGRAEAGDGRPFPPSLEDLEAWTGLRARASEIADLYASGACGPELQALAGAKDVEEPAEDDPEPEPEGP